jgi:hypothetical protein
MNRLKKEQVSKEKLSKISENIKISDDKINDAILLLMRAAKEREGSCFITFDKGITVSKYRYTGGSYFKKPKDLTEQFYWALLHSNLKNVFVDMLKKHSIEILSLSEKIKNNFVL